MRSETFSNINLRVAELDRRQWTIDSTVSENMSLENPQKRNNPRAFLPNIKIDDNHDII